LVSCLEPPLPESTAWRWDPCSSDSCAVRETGCLGGVGQGWLAWINWVPPSAWPLKSSGERLHWNVNPTLRQRTSYLYPWASQSWAYIGRWDRESRHLAKCHSLERKGALSYWKPAISAAGRESVHPTRKWESGHVLYILLPFLVLSNFVHLP
jgi:hypothetical protein